MGETKRKWEARKSPDQHSHWTIWRDGHCVFTCWTNEVDAKLAADALNSFPDLDEMINR
jgi:hypothetical protein